MQRDVAGRADEIEVATELQACPFTRHRIESEPAFLYENTSATVYPDHRCI